MANYGQQQYSEIRLEVVSNVLLSLLQLMKRRTSRWIVLFRFMWQPQGQTGGTDGQGMCLDMEMNVLGDLIGCKDHFPARWMIDSFLPLHCAAASVPKAERITVFPSCGMQLETDNVSFPDARSATTLHQSHLHHRLHRVPVHWDVQM